MKWLSTAFLVSLVAVAAALDLRLPDGTIYTDIRLLEKNDGGIRIAHTDGVASLNYRKMAPDDARTFGYDEAKFESWLKRVTARAEAEYVQDPQPQPVAPARPTYVPRAYTAPAPAPATRTTTGTARGQCSAYTKKGYRCSRMAAAGSSTCWQH